MAQNFDRQIAEKQAQIDKFKVEMEQLKDQFVSVSAPVIAALYEPVVKEVLNENLDRASQLTDNELREIKAEVIELRNNAAVNLKQEFSRSSIWWHLSGDIHASYMYRENHKPSTIDKPLKYVVGKIGVILERFKLIPTQGFGADAYKVWREWDKSGNNKVLQGRQFYGSNIEYSDEMVKVLEEYHNRHVNSVKLAKEITELTEQKSKYNVLDRWDNL